MSGNALPTESSPSWKMEINRRIAEHMIRKASAAVAEPAPPQAVQSGSRRAAEAAARVAARYAKVPSYSEMLASEARAVVRAAEAATRAAQQAQIAAESMLAGIEAIAEAEPEPASQPVLLPSPVRPDAVRLDGIGVQPAPDSSSPDSFSSDFFASSSISAAPDTPSRISHAENRAFEIRWEPDLPSLPSNPPMGHAAHGHAAGLTDRLGLRIEEMQTLSSRDERGREELEVVEPAQPIHANLIEFPRELVAARKARPRLADGPYMSNEVGSQLSIFEVEPSSVSTLPGTAEVLDPPAAPWTVPRWQELELEPRPAYEREEISYLPHSEAGQEPAAESHAIELAPVHRRLLAGLVDGTLIAGSLLSLVALALSRSAELPPIRTLEVGAVLGFVLVAILYEALFMTLSIATPGMMYAHLRLTTLDGQTPTRAQRFFRVAALLVSVLPAGLGMMWSIFDEDHMTWHDRLSHTYPKRKLV